MVTSLFIASDSLSRSEPGTVHLAESLVKVEVSSSAARLSRVPEYVPIFVLLSFCKDLF